MRKAILLIAITAAASLAVAQEQSNILIPDSSVAKPKDIGVRMHTAGSVMGAISGSGKKDYVAMWLTGSSLGDSKIFQSSGGEIGIGTTTPAATLDVVGTVNAATSFNLGGSSFAFGTFSKQNAFVGFSGNFTMTGADNTAAGAYALANNTTGFENTAVGDGALLMNTTGIVNTAVGVAALEANTSGSENTAIGLSALQDNSTGSDNTASGYGTLTANTSGFYNTANGWHALNLNTTADGNTASGYGSLGFNATGSYNTAGGMLALYYNTTGNFNTALGYSAGPDIKSTNLSYATAIGAGATVSQSNSMVLGGPLGSGTNVSVGIGTATPSNVFTIARGAGQAISDGWTVYSSRRWKTNIHTLHGALSKVGQLRGVSYELKASGKHEVGVIAEEVGAVVPEVVTWDKNGKDALSVDYSRLIALLIESTKEQQTLIHRQQEQIKAQRAQIARLASRVTTIQASLQSGRGGSGVRTVKAQARAVRQ
jgi:hypothetical protein